MLSPSDVWRGQVTVRYALAQSPSTEQEFRLAFATVGEAVRGDDNEIVNAVLLLHGTTGSGEQFLGGDTSIFDAGGALDQKRFYTIVPDALGHGRSSRPSEHPEQRFPAYGYLDLVALQKRVLHALGVKRPMAVIGTSMGGMLAWLWACSPGSCGACVAIACEPVALHGRNLLWRRVLVKALRDGAQLRHVMPLFAIMSRGIDALERDLPDRKSADAFVERLWQSGVEPEKTDVELEFDASFDYDPDLRALCVPTLAIAFEGDEVNPKSVSGSRLLADLHPDLVRYELISQDERSDGHQTLAQTFRWGPSVARFLNSKMVLEVPA